MAKSARERLARLLGESATGSFSAQLSAPANSLQLVVSGVGPVPLPVRAPLARKLIAVARPAMFGQGEQTLTDTSVRDTWELTPEQITLGGPGWKPLMDRALEHFRDELGLPPTARLRAEPHSMLVYGKGQFFLPHQDSESDDQMVGTLVVSLPSVHTGGELVIDHGGESKIYRAARDELNVVAFYADCRHQVMPVKSGYRLTITFNLLSTAETPAQDTESDAELAARLTEHFATPHIPRYGGRQLDPPNRLVFLLDHEYTQRSLSWPQLKGADAPRAARLRAAAERAGCDSVLALAEVKETWDALPSDDLDYYDDDQDDDSDDIQLTDLIDDEITLGWLTGPDGTGGEPISLYVPDHEVCAATPSVDLTPYQSEYEGYMGNYGNTLDRWYRRAAIVMWPRHRAFTARAEAGSHWAILELRRRIEAGDLEGARAATESLTPFWPKIRVQPEVIGTALDVAVGLGAAETAAMLLAPFRLEMITQGHAPGLAAAAGRYGDEWTRDVVDVWFGSRYDYTGPGQDEWVSNTLPGLCAALREVGQPGVARLLAAGTWRRLDNMLRLWTTTARAESRRRPLEELSSPLGRLLEAADPGLHDEITGALATYDDNVLECLIPALRSMDAQRTPWLDAVARDCAKRLRTIAARPPRDKGDWSVVWTGCGCDLCDTLATFLSSRSQQVHRWPLATDGRRHVHSQIDSAGLPVRHHTHRQGRPYTLVLTKTDDLFTRAANARDKAVADLAWLTSTWGTTTAPAQDDGRDITTPAP